MLVRAYYDTSQSCRLVRAYYDTSLSRPVSSIETAECDDVNSSTEELLFVAVRKGRK